MQRLALLVSASLALAGAASAESPAVDLTQPAVLETLPVPGERAEAPVAAGDACSVPGDLVKDADSINALLCHGNVYRALEVGLVPKGECASPGLVTQVDVGGTPQPSFHFGLGRALDGRYFWSDITGLVHTFKAGDAQSEVYIPFDANVFVDGHLPDVGRMKGPNAHDQLLLDPLANVMWLSSNTYIYMVDLSTDTIYKVFDTITRSRPGGQIVGKEFPGKDERGVIIKMENDILWCGAVSRGCEVIVNAVNDDISEGTGLVYFPPSSPGASAFIVSQDWTFKDLVVVEVDADYTDNDDYRINLKGVTPPAGCDAYDPYTSVVFQYDPISDTNIGLENNSPSPMLRFFRATNEADWSTMCIKTIMSASATNTVGQFGSTFTYTATAVAGLQWDYIAGHYLFGSPVNANAGIRGVCPPTPGP